MRHGIRGAALALVGSLLLTGHASAEELARAPTATIQLVTTGVPSLLVAPGDPPATPGVTCEPSCSVEVRAVEPRLQIVRSHRDPVVVRGLPAQVADGERFVLEYDTRSALHWVGGSTLVASSVAGAVMLIAGVLANPVRRCDIEGCYKDIGSPDVPLVIGGSAVFAVGMLVGTVLLTRDDRATVHPMR